MVASDRESKYAATRNAKRGAVLIFLLLLTGIEAGSALDYPARPVRLIVGYPAGGPTDILARLVSQNLSARLGQAIIVENRPGAGNNIATEAVVNAPPDGYTLLLVNAANMINATLYEKLSFNFIRDIAPVASIVRVPLVLEVNPSVPARTVPELIAYAKENPGKINMASGGIGTPQHVAGELFKLMTGANMIHVPYRGAAPALHDLLGGQVQIMFDTTTASIPHIRSGKLRALAVTVAMRLEILPDVPTVREFVPGYEASAVGGIGAPRKTPSEIVDKLNQEINAVLADPTVKGAIGDLGGIVIANSPAQFQSLIIEETAKWGEVVKFSGARPD